jgi:hypothetical protein
MRALGKISFLFVLVVSIACGSGSPPNSTNPPPPSPSPGPGSVSGVSSLSTCPADFYPGMACYQATVSCANTDDIKVIYGYKTPASAVKGTIFLHAGSGGTAAFSYGPVGKTYVDSYFTNGYRVVELEWASDWEIATAAGPENIKSAACRPATILNYVYLNIHGGSAGQGGMCAHGNSAGSAAMAYALTWYKSDAFLDKVVLTSGPVLGDIEAGCQVPNVPPITVCASGQFGCVGGPWTDAPQYQPGSNAPQKWTGDKTCNNVPAGQSTTAASNAAWKAQSIVDGTANANFSYPKTALSGWLCSNGLNPSAAQGQYYFQNIQGPSQTASFSLNRVDNCNEAEDVWNGTTSTGQNAFDASVNDMVDPVAGCVKRH